ncbi:MAG TPA: AraC family ligand binding domain-containing protein [Ktedonobacterales bacterium]|nr:AraC family ligand binding domain-containing protein [Ktedonobacterales bacterium]
MRLEQSVHLSAKGWYVGPWNSSLPVSVGYATTGIDEPHVHSVVTEIYLVAQGTAQIRIEQVTVTVSAGDMLVLEPGEAHTFLSSSPDYLHFVIHTPGIAGEDAHAEKVAVTRARLGV